MVTSSVIDRQRTKRAAELRNGYAPEKGAGALCVRLHRRTVAGHPPRSVAKLGAMRQSLTCPPESMNANSSPPKAYSTLSSSTAMRTKPTRINHFGTAQFYLFAVVRGKGILGSSAKARSYAAGFLM